MALVRRRIDLTFTLGEGTFGESGTNTVKLTGLRVQAVITKAGGPSMGTASLRVYGMTKSKMNQLSTLGMAITLVRRNSVVVEVGEDVAPRPYQQPGGTATAPPTTAAPQRTVVFVGTITNAWADFDSAPEVAFIVEAHTGLLETVAPMPPTSVQGTADVASLISSLATRMGRSFENNGVTAQLSNPYFTGSPLEQARAIAKAAGVEFVDDVGKIAIWQSGQARGGVAPLLKPPELRGYPTYTSKGIRVSTLFNPSIGYGGSINVQSSLTPANGTWVVYKLDYELASEMPRGPWFTNIEACRPGLLVVA